MDVKKFFAVSLIASAMSISVFAMDKPKTEFSVNTELNDIIKVEMENNIVTLNNSSANRLEGRIHLSIKMRGASSDTPRNYHVQVDQNDVSGDYQLLHEESDKGDMPLNIYFYSDRAGSGDELKNGVKKDKAYVNINGLDAESGFDSAIAFMVLEGKHENAYPGTYNSNLKLMVTAK